MQPSVPPAMTASASPRRTSSARLADRVRAGGTGRDDCVVGAAEAELDRDLPARRVDEDVGEEGRGDAVGPALAQDVVLAHQLVEAADAVADDHADALGRIDSR